MFRTETGTPRLNTPLIIEMKKKHNGKDFVSYHYGHYNGDVFKNEFCEFPDDYRTGWKYVDSVKDYIYIRQRKQAELLIKTLINAMKSKQKPGYKNLDLKRLNILMI